MNTVLPPDDAAHQAHVLMADVTQVNNLLGSYVLSFLHVDAGRAEPLSTDDERALAGCVTGVGDGLRTQAARRDRHGGPPSLIGRCTQSNRCTQSKEKPTMPSRSSNRAAYINYSALAPYTPYVSAWSEEKDPPSMVIERRGQGIAYLDETVIDRDSRGALWLRSSSRPGHGQPQFAKVHPLRQRRAMRQLLCNVCARPADRTDEGVLWLLKDHRDDWPGWPENMAVNEPPVCVPCARLASRLCPALRGGAVAIRARRAPIAGVHGTVYRSSGGLMPVAMEEKCITYDDPAIRWVRAVKLVRELHDCTIVPLEDVCQS